MMFNYGIMSSIWAQLKSYVWWIVTGSCITGNDVTGSDEPELEMKGRSFPAFFTPYFPRFLFVFLL